jgi:deoxycytidine triphosphate deaminase
VYLSNRDIKWAIDCGKLIVDPPPETFDAGYDETSIDLHLDSIGQGARVWDIDAYNQALQQAVQGRGISTGSPNELRLGKFDFNVISARYLTEVPPEPPEGQPNPHLVFRRRNADEIVVKRFGFLLWTTKETVGTPRIDLKVPAATQRHPELICFVNAKSSQARTGILVHFTAPTIHAGWSGKITLEITNLGPFDFVLREDDTLAQLTVATISSAPDLSLKKTKSKTQAQVDPSGAPPEKTQRKPGPGKSNKPPKAP